MIRTFKNRALVALWNKNDASKMRPDLVARVRVRLAALHAAQRPEEMNLPGFNFHRLRGKPIRFTVHVNGPWAITFAWDGEDAIGVNLDQYH